MRLGDKQRPIQERKKQAYQFFLERGYTPVQSAGIVGNLIAESSLNHQAGKNDKVENSMGLAQWNAKGSPERVSKFQQLYGVPIKQSTFEQQLDYVDWELKNKKALGLEHLQKAATPDEAALAISKYYERPHKDYAHNDRRITNARNLLQTFEGMEFEPQTAQTQQPITTEAQIPQQSTVTEWQPSIFDENLTFYEEPKINRIFAPLPDVVGTNTEETDKEDEESSAKTILDKKIAERNFMVGLLQQGAFNYVAPEYKRTNAFAQQQPVMQDGGKYTVQKGDNVPTIAKRNNLTVADIIALNPSLKEDPNVIREGDKITLTAQGYDYFNDPENLFIESPNTSPTRHIKDERYATIKENTTVKQPFKVQPKPIQIENKVDKVNIPYREKQEEDCQNYYGCVKGGVSDMARTLKVGVSDLRKKNNLFGDAWTIIDNTYGEDIDISKNFNNVKVGDIVSLTRKPFSSDKERGIPEKEQHFAYVTKIENGVPYVRHYINSTNDYYEEPINNISKFAKYKPERVKRPDSFKDITIDNKNVKAPFNNKNNQEERVIETINNDKEDIQKTLRLDSDEYDRLARLAYGIIGSETDYGKSKRAVSRMIIPDFILEQIQKQRGTYNKEYNPISQGYSSIKESTLYNISDNRNLKEIQKKVGLKGKDIDGIYGPQTKKAIEEYNKVSNEKIEYKPLKQKLDEGDYKDLSKTQNYLPIVMAEMGIDIESLENPTNALKATMAVLAKTIKENPNITDEDILKKYTGKKDVYRYAKKVESYKNNLDNDPMNDIQSTIVDDIYGLISRGANATNDKIKELKSEIVKQVTKNSTYLPINIRAIAAASTGADFEITEDFLSESAKEKLKNIVKNNVSKNKYTIEYGDYGTGRLEDVGGKTSKTVKDQVKQALTDEGSILKQFLGQAVIRDIGNGEYEIVDTYDFNNKGESFGVIDDAKKRGASPYTIVRSIGTNYGKANGLGNKVRIKVKI